MIRPRYEHTLAAACEVRGRGYWSGQTIHVRFLPAAAGTGIRMVRTDLPGRPQCPALTSHAAEQSLRTNLSAGAARFEMIEHLMAALYALQIDNCIVEVDAAEMPGFDGSAQRFTDALRAAGLVEQTAVRKCYVIDRPFRVGDETCWVTAEPVSGDRACYEYHLDYGDHTPIVPQTYSGTLDAMTFCRELAAARTFVTADQVAQLQAQGVGRHVGPQDLLVFDANGLIDNALRFDNECARHKTLDLIGDLSLVGVDLIGRFVSCRGGHRLNAELARALAAAMPAACRPTATFAQPAAASRPAA